MKAVKPITNLLRISVVPLAALLLFGTPAVCVAVSLLPTVVTQPATGVTASGATLNGLVNPNGTAAIYLFKYGLTTSYGSYAGTNFLAPDTSPVAVNVPVSGLLPGTLYHYQLMAINSFGPGTGSDMTFTTATVNPLSDAVTMAGNSIVGYANGAVGFSFTPTTNLAVTRVGYLYEGNVNPIISFWASTNFPIASFALVPGTTFDTMVYTNVSLTLLAGQPYSITLQEGSSFTNTFLFRAYLSSNGELFQVAAELTAYAYVFVNASGVFSPGDSNGFFLGPNFSYSVQTINGVIGLPHFTGISVSGTAVTLNATNGTSGGQYTLLGSTNVAGPWTAILTNSFDGSGNLNLFITNSNPAVHQQFYMLKQ
jgi:hypothetical protein